MPLTGEAKAEWRRRNREGISAQLREWKAKKVASDPGYLEREREKERARRIKKASLRPPRMCNCGKPTPTRSIKYCSPECRPPKRVKAQAKKEQQAKKCAVCPNEFVPKMATQIFCSAECRKSRESEKSNEYARKRYATNPEYRARQIAKSSERFATDPEYREQERVRRAVKRTESRRLRTEEKLCGWCGQPFMTANKKKKYCGRDCLLAEMGQRNAKRNRVRYWSSADVRAKHAEYGRLPEVRKKNIQYSARWKSRMKAENPEAWAKICATRSSAVHNWRVKKLAEDPGYESRRQMLYRFKIKNAAELVTLAIDAGTLMEKSKCSRPSLPHHRIPPSTSTSSRRCQRMSFDPSSPASSVSLPRASDTSRTSGARWVHVVLTSVNSAAA